MNKIVKYALVIALSTVLTSCEKLYPVSISPDSISVSDQAQAVLFLSDHLISDVYVNPETDDDPEFQEKVNSSGITKIIGDWYEIMYFLPSGTEKLPQEILVIVDENTSSEPRRLVFTVKRDINKEYGTATAELVQMGKGN